jgi:hypothetical protein
MADGTRYVLNLKSAKATPLDGDSSIGETGEASIWSKEPAWLERFKPNDEVLAYGHWKQAKNQKPVRAPSSPASFRGYLNRELSMWLLFPAQLAKLSEVD